MGLPNSLLRSFRHATHLTLQGMPAMGCRVTVIGSSNRVILSTHRSGHEEWLIFCFEENLCQILFFGLIEWFHILLGWNNIDKIILFSRAEYNLVNKSNLQKHLSRLLTSRVMPPFHQGLFCPIDPIWTRLSPINHFFDPSDCLPESPPIVSPFLTRLSPDYINASNRSRNHFLASKR